MKSINEVTLLGNLTRDPEIKYTPSGSSVVKFSIATNRQWFDKKSNEKKEAADFHEIVFWGKAAEIIQQYAKKGSRILVKGRLQTRSWDDKEGNKKYRTEVVGNDFVVFDKKIESDAKLKEEKSVSQQEEQPNNEGGNEEVVNPDDIPF